jgi:quinol-cytochrome oxidoreductase complex cytochrome b subunit
MVSLKRIVNRFLDERYDMEAARRFVDKQLHKPLPPNTGWLHVLGSMSLFLFINQVVTGILLLLYYRPTPEEAYKSIQFLQANVTCGWLYRQLHAWGATLMVLFVTLHMVRTFFMGAFKKPRELTWVVGVLILMATITFGFTGYLLPWNQLSYWATTVGTEIAGTVPGIGHAVRTVMLGGATVGRETLSRFFTVHVIVLPWVLTFLIALHLVFVRLQNLATLEPVGEEKPYPASAGIPFWPVHMAKEGAVVMTLLALMLTLAILSPWEIGKPANPLETPEGIKPEWYFLPTYQLLKYFSGERAKVLGIFAGNIPFLLLFVWPFLERGKYRHPRGRRIAVTIGILGAVLALAFGTLGYLSETRRTILGRTVEFDMYGRPSIVQPQLGPQAPTTAPGASTSR